MRSSLSLTNVTPTRLSVYLDCPYRHYLKYVRRTPELSAVTPALAVGRALHATLHRAFRYRGECQRDPLTDPAPSMDQ